MMIVDLIPQKSSTRKIFANHYSRTSKSSTLALRRIHPNNAVTATSKEAIVRAMEVAMGRMEERSLQWPLRPRRRPARQELAVRQITLLTTPNITAAKILMPLMVVIRIIWHTISTTSNKPHNSQVPRVRLHLLLQTMMRRHRHRPVGLLPLQMEAIIR